MAERRFMPGSVAPRPGRHLQHSCGHRTKSVGSEGRYPLPTACYGESTTYARLFELTHMTQLCLSMSAYLKRH